MSRYDRSAVRFWALGAVGAVFALVLWLALVAGVFFIAVVALRALGVGA